MVKREIIKTKKLERSLQLQPDLLADKSESLLTVSAELTLNLKKKKVPFKHARLLTTAFFKIPL